MGSALPWVERARRAMPLLKIKARRIPVTFRKSRLQMNSAELGGAGAEFLELPRGELGCYCKNFVCFWVERHGARALLRGNIFDDRVFVGSFFVDDGERAAL